MSRVSGHISSLSYCHANNYSTQPSPLGSPSANLESVFLLARLVRIHGSFPDSRSRPDGLDGARRHSIVDGRSQPRGIELSPPPVPYGTTGPFYLTELEIVIFRNFVERVARWVREDTRFQSVVDTFLNRSTDSLRSDRRILS